MADRYKTFYLFTNQSINYFSVRYVKSDPLFAKTSPDFKHSTTPQKPPPLGAIPPKTHIP
jgi:hypothetical protein